MCEDCKYSGEKNAVGLFWCEKKKRYVSEELKETCPDYEVKE